MEREDGNDCHSKGLVSSSAANLNCLLCESEDWTPIPHSKAMAKLTIISPYDSQEAPVCNSHHVNG